MSSRNLVLALAVIAAVVAIGLLAGVAMWPLISFYWMVLTVKNVIDYTESGEGRNGKRGVEKRSDDGKTEGLH